MDHHHRPPQVVRTVAASAAPPTVVPTDVDKMTNPHDGPPRSV